MIYCRIDRDIWGIIPRILYIEQKSVEALNEITPPRDNLPSSRSYAGCKHCARYSFLCSIYYIPYLINSNQPYPPNQSRSTSSLPSAWQFWFIFSVFKWCVKHFINILMVASQKRSVNSLYRRFVWNADTGWGITCAPLWLLITGSRL